MKRKVLTTVLLSTSLLSLNLFAAGQVKCTGSYCVVDLSKNPSNVKKSEVTKVATVKEAYETVIIDNIETIVFSKDRYVMTDNEAAEYELDNISHRLTNPSLDTSSLPDSEYYCEDNLKAVKVVGIENTYECT